MIKGRILVIDDDPVNQMLLQTNLEAAGYQVSTASSGFAGRALIFQQPFDVILLDLVMPEMDGYTLLAELKGNREFRHLPIVVISAQEELGSVVRCIEMGAADYLTKPFDPVILHARINASLATNRLHQMEQAYLRKIEMEQAKSEQLLLNILPAPIAARLKEGESQIVEQFAEATVLFADLVGFTRFAAMHSSETILHLLNRIFSTFDQLVSKYQLEKIKTSGDAYMAAAGVPITRPDHVEAMADLALDMLAASKAFVELPLPVRIGFHTGPLTAGVIGTTKFSYDLWGDTVNTASRMESLSPPDGILISEPVWQKLQQSHVCLPQGMMNVKGKGKMLTYLLKERRK